MTLSPPALVYLHGMPGAPGELGLVPGLPASLYAPDRTQGSLADRHALAADIARRFAGRPVILIGFSMGAFAALRLAHALPGQIAHLHLIAPAAPLELGDYLPHMQGRAVFKTARDRRWLFGSLTRAQALIAQLAPDMLAKQVFAGATGADRALADDPAFRERWSALLRHGLAKGAQGYRREVLDYVRPWSALLPQISTPTTLWHGTADNWAPPAMSDALAARLPGATGIEKLEGLSHYSALRAALPRVLAMVER